MSGGDEARSPGGEVTEIWRLLGFWSPHAPPLVVRDVEATGGRVWWPQARIELSNGPSRRQGS